jgi:uncharacterized protein (TIGR00730 family)
VKRISVFCGSSMGASPEYEKGARALGKLLAEKGIGVVYGGASVGLMGAVADAAMEAGGEVIGIMPKSLAQREITHNNLTDLHIVNTMHERKAMMAHLSDGFISLPGGAGTMEEFFEVFTWAMIGEHKKPCGLLNINNYYTPLLTFFDHMVQEKFLKEESRKIVMVESDAAVMLEKFMEIEKEQA